MRSKMIFKRSSGVLMPVTMLHGPYGIGVLGEEAIEFIDFLCDCGFHAWQVLPVENTGESFSPYKCVSAFAGEPMLIDPRGLLEMGLADSEELEKRAEGMSGGSVDFETVRSKQRALLKAAFSRLEGSPHSDFKPFWLDDYALYMAIREDFGGAPWYEWPDEGLKLRERQAVESARERLAGVIEFYKFVQWLFDVQWRRIHSYAGRRGVSVIGDMPFYVSEDSAEVWSRRELFDAGESGGFPAVGGAPPDYFNPLGQCWGNPVYNWRLMKKDGYKWWIDRVGAAARRYDIIRLDHFRGFESFWSIPADMPDARGGGWVRGPGMPLFKALGESLGRLPVIAEDLGVVDERVERLLERSGFAGMRVLQFGFLGDDKHLPHCYTENCVAYTGTHDNTTLLAWLFELREQERERALFYLGFTGDWTIGGPNCEINRAWIRTLYMSGASVVIIPIQDMLGYGADTRTNTPGSAEGNWRFRINAPALEAIDRAFYSALGKAFGRDNVLMEEGSEDGGL